MLTSRPLSITPPVDVMVAGDGEPGHQQLVHGARVLLHLPHPLRCLVVPVDEIAHRHDKVWFDQVHVRDGFTQHADAGSRSPGAVAEHSEHERVILQRQIEIDAFAIGMKSIVIMDHLMRLGIKRVMDIAESGCGDDEQNDGGNDVHVNIPPPWNGEIKSSTVCALEQTP